MNERDVIEAFRRKMSQPGAEARERTKQVVAQEGLKRKQVDMQTQQAVRDVAQDTQQKFSEMAAYAKALRDDREKETPELVQESVVNEDGEVIIIEGSPEGLSFGDDVPSALPASLIQTESGGNFQAANDVPGSGGTGHFGRGQFSKGRLQEAKNAGVIPQDLTPEQFLSNPEHQEAVESWHVNDIMKFIKRNKLDGYIGSSIRGVPVTVNGMIAVAHLGGKGGLKKFINSGGDYNPSDAYGTSLMDYLNTHRG